MLRKLCIALFVLYIVAVDVRWGFAQEPEAPVLDAAESTAEENKYFDLRKSEDRLTRQLADRYFNLVKFQEWSSDKGTTIKAKYVSHEPDLSSVTLLIVKGSRDNRTEREVAVQVAKLNKSGQSRVKQIDIIQKKLDEQIAGGAAGGDAGQIPGQPSVDPGAPMTDELGAQPSPRSRSTARPQRTRVRETDQPPAPRPAAASVADDGDPDPLGFGEISDTPQAPNAAPALPAIGGPDGPPATGVLVGPAPAQPKGKSAWQTDYDAFRANIKVDASRERPQIDWGSLRALKEAVAIVQKFEATGSVDEAAQREITQKFEEVGEFTWEATLTDAEVAEGDWTERLNMPPLPEPLSIGFILDPNSDPAATQRLKAGDRVRFTGRFVDFENDGDLVATIQFTNDAPATPAAE